MKRLIRSSKIFLLAMVMILVGALCVHAIPYENSGELLYISSGGTYGNDSASDLETILTNSGYDIGNHLLTFNPGPDGNLDVRYDWGNTFIDYDFDVAGKVDYAGGSYSVQEGPYNITINTSEDSASSEWSIDEGVNVEFYALKDANAYALYWLKDPASSGTWSPEDLRDADFGSGTIISHFSAYNPIERVPEPAAMLLMGMGLVGIAGWTRGKLKKKKG